MACVLHAVWSVTQGDGQHGVWKVQTFLGQSARVFLLQGAESVCVFRGSVPFRKTERTTDFVVCGPNPYLTHTHTHTQRSANAFQPSWFLWRVFGQALWGLFDRAMGARVTNCAFASLLFQGTLNSQRSTFSFDPSDLGLFVKVHWMSQLVE